MMNVVFTMANNSSVPYFNWFAEESQKHADIKISFVALHSERPKMLDDMQQRGCDCYWVPFHPDHRKRDMLKAVPKLVKLFRKLKPEVVHSHLFDDAVPVLLAARIAGIKVRVITKAETGFHWNYAPKAVLFDKFNNWNATHVVAISSESRKFLLEKEKVNENKLSIIHHGVPVNYATAQTDERKAKLRSRFGVETAVVIGTVSRMIKWKGYLDIIDAATEIIPAHPDICFLFTGTGSQEAELKKAIEEKGLGRNIRFTGWVDRDDIPSLYGIMDIYLHAASYEPFGFVIAEAMMNGVPVVSTPTGAAKDAIVHKQNGYLASSPHELAEGIKFMLSHNRKQIGERGKQTALEMYSFGQMWNNHIELYKTALARMKN